MSKLEAINLRRVFQTKQGEFVAVDDLSFCVESGTILALLGPNGAGKTTTVQMISGYLAPSGGSVLINETPIDKMRRMSKKIGVVFGGELGFYARATAQDNLQFFSNLAKLPHKIQKQEIARVLEAVGLTQVSLQNVGTFSRGMRQRLHIARALLGNPDILLLDEPTNGLDVEIAHELRELIRSLAQNGAAIVLTSHTMSEIEALANRVLLLGSGKVFHDGTIESVVALSQVKHIDRAASLEESYLALAPMLRRE